MFQGMISACLVLLLAAASSAYNIENMISNDNGQGGQSSGYGNSGYAAPAPVPGEPAPAGYVPPAASAPVPTPAAPAGGLAAALAAAPAAAPATAPAPAANADYGGLQFDTNAAQPVTQPGQGASQSFNPMDTMQGGAGGGGGHGGQPANPLTALLGGIQTASNSGNNNFGNTGGDLSNAALSQDAHEVVRGLVESFMHKAALSRHEKNCLRDNLAELAGGIMGTVGDITKAIQAMIAGKGAMNKQTQGALTGSGLDGVMKITSLVTSATSLSKGCVHGDALDMMTMAAHHLINGTYLQHRILVSGIDIAKMLADAVVSFEHKNFYKFGSDIGIALRKILLSTSNHAIRLPEGVPQKAIIGDTTEGLMAGFFVRSSAMSITDTAAANVHINVDLHQCIANNHEFFKEIWLAMWNLIAQLAANGLQHDMANMFSTQSGKQQPKWMSEMMIALMQFPMALQKCGLSMDMQNMFMDAIKTIGNLQVHFTFPRDTIEGVDASQKMAKAVEAWTNWNFKSFGYELGKLLRELVMMAFPQQYSIDASGRLQKAMLAEIQPRSLSSKTPVMIIGGASVSLLFALAVVRTKRSTPQENHESLVPMTDIEDGDCLEVE